MSYTFLQGIMGTQKNCIVQQDIERSYTHGLLSVEISRYAVVGREIYQRCWGDSKSLKGFML